ncbi:hypothetical protein [Tardiphaga sp. 803_E3_N1_3]|uniref:hypothetical protein n=1 Tax=Tardiphaga sp. 803_E3_N1_3 TaxID=3240785 RepID=UPI003F206A88
MSKGKSSGYHLTNNDAAIVLGQSLRGDRDHDIAAWFGVNQGRIAEVKAGSHGTVAAAPFEDLPPKGAPGIKGRQARYNLGEAQKALNEGDVEKAKTIIETAIAKYDEHET